MSDATPGIGHNIEALEDAAGISAKDLQAILVDLDGFKKSVSEATGRLNAKLKFYIEDQEWHKGAVSILRKIDALSPKERADFLRTFDDKYNLLKVCKWDAESKDMIDGIDDDIGEASPRTNVVPMSDPEGDKDFDSPAAKETAEKTAAKKKK